MKRLLILILCFGLPCFADTTEILQDLILQEQKVLTCKTDCNEQMNMFYKQLIEQVPIASQGNWDLTADEELNYTLHPETDIVTFTPNCEEGIWINYKHLKTYKLPRIWKEYLNVFNDHDTMALYDYNEVEGLKFINKSNKFMKKHPNFPFNYYLKEQQDLITKFICGVFSDFIYPIESKQVKIYCTFMGIGINVDQ